MYFAQGSWKWQNPLPQGADMFAVFALSNNRTIITGSGAHYDDNRVTN